MTASTTATKASATVTTTSTNSAAPEEPPSMRLLRCITGHWVTAAVYSAAKLGLADRSRDAALSSDELAQAVGAHGPSLYRLLRALASLGIVAEVAPRKFRLTEVGDLLRSDHPDSLRSFALFEGAPPHWRGWGNFLHSVRTGESAFENVHGQQFFDYCQTDSEFAAAFNSAMTGMSSSTIKAVLEACDFSGIRKLVDVGGGYGHLLIGILQRYPAMRGAILDLGHVSEGAKAAIDKAGLANRCEFVTGSFFDTMPRADGYIAKHIIHDWDDEHSRKILTNMRSAIEGNGKVLVVDAVIRPGADNSFPAMMDLEMLHATHGGRERTEAEFRERFASAGLRLNRVVATQSMLCVLEAVPA